MGLIARYRRLRYAWGWRARYWWMDTASGRRAHVAAFCIGVLVILLQLVRMSVAALMPRPVHAPQTAVYWWVIQLIIMVVAAAVAYALRPKPPKQAERQIESPTVEDGTAVKDHGGTVWIDHEDSFLLAWKIVGRDPIKKKSGK
ncbi:MAG TPA: hypothetical protein VM619_14880 [Luteimonas sp.]|nr:hypothetical protein [Luteimonas sp.]